MSSHHIFVTPIDSHPIPLDQDEIDEMWENDDWLDGEPPHVDEAHEEHARTIADYSEWHVFRPTFPFGHGDMVFWNRSFGGGFVFNDEEGSWHQLVNVFAEIVDEEGDCRDAEYADSLRQSSSVEQRCKNCNDSYTVG